MIKSHIHTIVVSNNAQHINCFFPEQHTVKKIIRRVWHSLPTKSLVRCQIDGGLKEV